MSEVHEAIGEWLEIQLLPDGWENGPFHRSGTHQWVSRYPNYRVITVTLWQAEASLHAGGRSYGYYEFGHPDFPCDLWQAVLEIIYG